MSEQESRTLGEFDIRYKLVLDQTEIDHVVNSVAEELEDVSGLMILVGDAEYKEIWYSESTAPYRLGAFYNRII